MKIDVADIESRQRINDLRAAFTDAIGSVMKRHKENVTYAELFVAMSETQLRWSQHLRADDLKCGDAMKPEGR